MNRRLLIMNSSWGLGLLFFAAFSVYLPAATKTDEPPPIEKIEFPEAKKISPRIQKMLDKAVALTREDLDYMYGVSDPERGFDCSGMVYYLLNQMGAPNVPRQANTLCEWVRDKKSFHSGKDPDDLEELEPGDLLFWSGTYKIDRDITHVMIYLGMDEETGQRWMVGAASSKYGIGVFKFDPNSTHGIGRNYVGYGKVESFFPGGTPIPKSLPVTVAALEPKPSKPEKAPALRDPEPVPRSENTFFQASPRGF